MNNGTRAGTFGGTLLSVFVNLDSSDFLRTAVLAAIGAVVSFFVSLLLKWILKYLKGIVNKKGS